MNISTLLRFIYAVETDPMKLRSILVSILLVSTLLLSAHGPIHEKIHAVNKKIAKDPLNAYLYVERSSYYKIDRNYDGAQADLLHAQLLNPGIMTISFLMAELNYEFEYYRSALVNINQFETYQTSLGETYLLKAKVFDKLLEVDSALHYVTKAYPLQDVYSTHFFLLASQLSLNANNTDYGAAKAWLVLGKKHLPYDLVLQEELVDLALRYKRFQEAEEYCVQQIPKLKRKEYWQYLLAMVYKESGRSADCLASLDAAEASIASLPRHHRNTDYIKNLNKKIKELKDTTL